MGDKKGQEVFGDKVAEVEDSINEIHRFSKNPDAALVSVSGRRQQVGRGNVIGFLSHFFRVSPTTTIAMLKTLAVNMLVAYYHSRQISVYYNANTVMDELVSKIADLEAEYDIQSDNTTKSRMNLIAQFFNRLILRRKRSTYESKQLTNRQLEYEQKQQRLQNKAFRYVSSRIVAALGQHLFRSLIQHGGVYEALRSSPTEKPEDIGRWERLIIEEKIVDLEHHLELVQKASARAAVAKKGLQNPKDASPKQGKSAPNAGGGLQESHSELRYLVFAAALKVELVKLRIASLARYLDRTLSTERSKYISSIVNATVNIISSAYATYDAAKLTQVVKNTNLRLPRFHRSIPHWLYGWIRVNSYRWIPTSIHLVASYVNVATCTSTRARKIALKGEVELLRALEVRMRSAAGAIIKTVRAAIR